MSTAVPKSFKIVGEFSDPECSDIIGNPELIVNIGFKVLPPVIIEEEEEEFEDLCHKDNITLADTGIVAVDFSKLDEDKPFKIDKAKIEKMLIIKNKKCKIIKASVSMKEKAFDPIPKDYSVSVSADNSLAMSNTKGAPELKFFLVLTTNKGFSLAKKIDVKFTKADEVEEEGGGNKTAKIEKPTAKDNKAPKFASDL